jgi:hypothetical protein
MTTEELMSDTKPTRFCITCSEPGCFNHIHYTRDDDEVSLYCEKHRTKEGRHSRVRVLKEPPKPVVEEKVVMRCPNGSCKHRITILKSDWLHNGVAIKVMCPTCGGMMLYHKDQESHEQGAQGK